MSDLKSRLDEIITIVENDSFLNRKSMGGEINFHIFDYDPKDELVVRQYISTFVKSHSYSNSKVKPIEFDLFELILEILQQKKVKDKTILEMSIDMEANNGSEKLIRSISGMLKPEAFINIISERISNHNLIILSGVGKAYPIIRSHTILNNLHHVISDIPVIMFYPGEYDQKELKLFCGEAFEGLKDDNYYRAFRLVARKK